MEAQSANKAGSRGAALASWRPVAQQPGERSEPRRVATGRKLVLNIMRGKFLWEKSLANSAY